MTSDDPTPRPHDRRDELASALLDGTLPAAEADAARRDPAVVGRAAELAAVRARLRDVPPLPEEASEDALAAALGAYDDAAVTSLAARRARGRRGAPRWLGAAAALVLVAAGIAGLAAVARSGGGARSSQTATGGGSAADRAEPESSSAAGGGSAAAVPAGVHNLGDLGDAPSAAALADRAVATAEPLATASEGADRQSRVGAPPAASSKQDGRGQLGQSLGATCSAADVARARPGVTPEAHGRGRADGRAVDVWIVSRAGARRVLVLDGRCDVVADAPVP